MQIGDFVHGMIQSLEECPWYWHITSSHSAGSWYVQGEFQNESMVSLKGFSLVQDMEVGTIGSCDERLVDQSRHIASLGASGLRSKWHVYIRAPPMTWSTSAEALQCGFRAL